MKMPWIEKWPQEIELTQNAILRLFLFIFIILTCYFVTDIITDEDCLTVHQMQELLERR